MGKTLTDYIDKLKPVQLDFICSCVQEYNNRAELHRGTLPFLSVTEAATALNCWLAGEKQKATTDMNIRSIAFVRKILSRIEAASVEYFHEDEESVSIELSSVVLQKRFGRKVADKFYVACPVLPPAFRLVSLERSKMKNVWKVTAKKGYLDRATTWLAENFRN